MPAIAVELLELLQFLNERDGTSFTIEPLPSAPLQLPNVGTSTAIPLDAKAPTVQVWLDLEGSQPYTQCVARISSILSEADIIIANWALQGDGRCRIAAILPPGWTTEQLRSLLSGVSFIKAVTLE